MIVNIDAQQIMHGFSSIAQQGSIKEVTQALAALQIAEKALIKRLQQEKLKAKVGAKLQQHRDQVKSQSQPQQHRDQVKSQSQPQQQPQKPRVKTPLFTNTQRKNEVSDFDYWRKEAVETDTKKENEALDYWALFNYS